MSYLRATEQNKYSRVQNNASLRLPLFPIFCLILLSVGCTQTHSENSSATEASETTQAGTSETSAAPPPLHLDQKLAVNLDQLLKSPPFSDTRWGVAVISLKDDKLIYDHNGDQLFTPASNMKVYTTAVALDMLGGDYRWRTSVYSATDPDDSGAIHGDLVLYGRGAPDLLAADRNDNSSSIEQLAKTIAARGIKHIQGNVVGDESYFRGDPTGEGWQWNDLQWYFAAEASALTVNANSVDVSITSAAKMGDQPKVVSTDIDGYVQLTNNIATVAQGERLKIGVQRGLSDNHVVVWGQYPLGARGYGISLSVHRPSLWAAIIFLRALKSQGITVDGVAQFRDSRVAAKDRFNPDLNRELASVLSKPLSEIISVTNKLSVNLYAELILRTLGRERAALLPNEDLFGREVGDDERGTSLVRLWLRRQGIKTAGLAIHDGSGLSRLDLVTPRVTAQLLEAVRKTASAPAFVDSLPVAGTDGTLQGRLQGTNGRIRAKTGSLTYDNSLSGYLTSTGGQIFAFSVVSNDYVAHGGSAKLIDQLLLTLVSYVDKGSVTQEAAAPKAKP